MFTSPPVQLPPAPLTPLSEFPNYCFLPVYPYFEPLQVLGGCYCGWLRISDGLRDPINIEVHTHQSNFFLMHGMYQFLSHFLGERVHIMAPCTQALTKVLYNVFVPTP